VNGERRRTEQNVKIILLNEEEVIIKYDLAVTVPRYSVLSVLTVPVLGDKTNHLNLQMILKVL
jgi:hypothetical protein